MTEEESEDEIIVVVVFDHPTLNEGGHEQLQKRMFERRKCEYSARSVKCE